MEKDEELPAGWTREESKTHGRPYYHHAKSGKSLWSLDEVRQSAIDKPDFSQTKRFKPTQHKVAIIVPFRDLDPKQHRTSQLKSFAPHMCEFLKGLDCVEDFRIYVIEQSDDGRKFNRGKLLNFGFLIGKQEGFDTFVFQDVDLLPKDPLKVWYNNRPDLGHPVHIARCWSRYNQSDKYLGGIVSFTAEDFEKIDGFPNLYWGWGGEDDELSKRVIEAKLVVEGPERGLANAIVDLEQMSLEEKLSWLRSNKQVKCQIKWEVNDVHDKARNLKDKPKWWGLSGLAVELPVRSRDNERFEKCSIITFDIGLNYDNKGKEHWTNESGKAI